MSLLIQKFGGTSVADPESLRNAARRIATAREAGHSVVAVVSAMGGSTDGLVGLAAQLSQRPADRELDLLLSTGELASASALSIALCEVGVSAVSFTGHDAGIITDGVHGRARIVDVDPSLLEMHLDEGTVPVVTGFQGISSTSGELTTLGRGGSDTTAVALTAALGATACEIYTDIEGVFTADPRYVPGAYKLDCLAYEDMCELAVGGAKILAHSSVEYASTYQVPVHVRSSFDTSDGTWVNNHFCGGPAEIFSERFVPTGVAHQTGQSHCRLGGVEEGTAAAVFAALADAAIPLDMVSFRTQEDALLFTVQTGDQPRVSGVLGEMPRGTFTSCDWSEPVGKVSLVGRALSAHPRILSQVLESLRDSGVALGDVAVYAKRISVTCREDAVISAVATLHKAFLERQQENAGTGLARLGWQASKALPARRPDKAMRAAGNTLVRTAKRAN
ncbi:aspartate kinase [Actinopolyspora erythraea]|uniref:Aspartokinase n=1 Tax=Actinopolyspora erythraea TaxID=414996 RepID=A0A223RTH2_9ACTN|nr:aspartate kinase [Actinopolyspora erythraea]ASU79173.1 aspartate kinase [Actinopolyspora erythraea]